MNNSKTIKTKLSGRRIPQPIILSEDKYQYLDQVLNDSWAILYRNIALDDVHTTYFKSIKLVKNQPNTNEISHIVLKKRVLLND